MKILIVSQRYWPESFRITDIAESLVSIGHEVTVLTGLPNYPKGYVLPDYKKGKNRRQVHNGVEIIRAKEIGRRNNIVFRFLNYYSFPIFANKLIRKLPSDFDVVLINELSPIMGSKPGIKYARKHKKPIVMYEMDLWPESLLAGGIKKGSFLFRHYTAVSGKIYSGCDKILVSTEEHIAYIKSLPKCADLNIGYLPQYAESLFEENDLSTIENGTLDVMFAGNVGKAQSVETIIRAANLLKSLSDIKFHIVGGGSELENLRKLVAELGLKNVELYGPKPLDEMPSFYRMADIMLVTLENKPYANMTIPGKVQSYMACGKPICGSANGAVAHLIDESGCGIIVPAESPQQLADAIRSIKESDLKQYSARSKDYYQKHFSKKNFLEALTECLASITSKEDR